MSGLVESARVMIREIGRRETAEMRPQAACREVVAERDDAGRLLDLGRRLRAIDEPGPRPDEIVLAAAFIHGAEVGMLRLPEGFAARSRAGTSRRRRAIASGEPRPRL